MLQLLFIRDFTTSCDKAKKTPLFIACEEGYIDIVRLLIESKCEIFNHSCNGQTVLHAVCRGLNVKWCFIQVVTLVYDTLISE
jgi:ankyrin repeat protein